MGVAEAIIGGGAALVGGGLSFLGSKKQSKASEKAAEYQQQAADQATQAQLEMYYQGREDLAPWREFGERGLSDLEFAQTEYAGAVRDPNQYIESPGYGWLQEQGIAALNRGASARGKLDSGESRKDLIKYGQGLALQDYGGYLGRLESLMNRYAGSSGVGQTASNTLASMGMNTANQIGSNAMYAGQAQAAGQIGQANARTGLYSNLSGIASNAANQYMTLNYLQNMRKPATP